MLTIVSGTNRPNSKTKFIAEQVSNFLNSKGISHHFIDLEKVSGYIDLNTMYDPTNMHNKLAKVQDEQWIPSRHLIFVSPEYNGSFSGVLKMFVDAISVRKYAETFKGKKALLIGVSSGRAGNLRGMEHLTGFLNYLKINVFPVKLPISQITAQIDESGNLVEATKEVLEQTVTDFLGF